MGHRKHRILSMRNEHEQFATWACRTTPFLATFIIPEWIFETGWLHNNYNAGSSPKPKHYCTAKYFLSAQWFLTGCVKVSAVQNVNERKRHNQRPETWFTQKHILPNRALKSWLPKIAETLPTLVFRACSSGLVRLAWYCLSSPTALSVSANRGKETGLCVACLQLYIFMRFYIRFNCCSWLSL